jgi:hypothetical protein
MKRHHRILLAVSVIVLLAGWLAWSMLLTESEMPKLLPPSRRRNDWCLAPRQQLARRGGRQRTTSPHRR